MEQMMSDERNGSGRMAGSAGSRETAGPPCSLSRSSVSRVGQMAWFSVGGVRQGAASCQMPNPAETGSYPHITPGLVRTYEHKPTCG